MKLVIGWTSVAVMTAAWLAVILAAWRRNAEREREQRRQLARPRVQGRYTPPPASPWVPQRLVQGGGLRRLS